MRDWLKKKFEVCRQESNEHLSIQSLCEQQRQKTSQRISFFRLLSGKLKNTIMNVKTRRLRFIFNDNSFIFLQNKVAFPSPIVLWHQDAASFSKTEFCVNCFLGQKRSSTAIDRGQCPALPLLSHINNFQTATDWGLSIEKLAYNSSIISKTCLWCDRLEQKSYCFYKALVRFFPSQYKNSFFLKATSPVVALYKHQQNFLTKLKC